MRALCLFFAVTGALSAQSPRPPAGAARAAAPPPTDTLQPPTWVLTRDKPKVGEVVEAWLVVPRYAAADSTATVSLLPPATAGVWFRSGGSGCPETEAENRHTVTGPLARDTILFACVRPTDDGTLRLVAVRRALDAAGQRTVQRISVSEALSVSSKFTLSPTLAAILSALGGFLAGFLGHIITQWWDRKQAGKRSVEEIQAVALKALTPELTENRRRLEAFLPAATGPAPNLLVVGYNAVLGDKGVTAFLEADTQKEYFGKLEAVYLDIRNYTRLKNTDGTPPDQLKEAAERALARVKAPLA